jgi:hypothetical protein
MTLRRFACIATARRRRAFAASLGSPAVRSRRSIASLRRASGTWQHSTDGAAHEGADQLGPMRRAPDPLPAIISRR